MNACLGAEHASGGGSLNLWDEEEFDAYYATFEAIPSQTETDMQTAPAE